jgi:hypothetical protein
MTTPEITAEQARAMIAAVDRTLERVIPAEPQTVGDIIAEMTRCALDQNP